MNDGEKIQLEKDVALEFQENTTPLARFEEYVRISKELHSESDDANSSKGECK